MRSERTELIHSSDSRKCRKLGWGKALEIQSSFVLLILTGRSLYAGQLCQLSSLDYLFSLPLKTSMAHL